MKLSGLFRSIYLGLASLGLSVIMLSAPSLSAQPNSEKTQDKALRSLKRKVKTIQASLTDFSHGINELFTKLVAVEVSAKSAGGIPGPQGIQGIAGPQGNTGPQGVAGPQGVPGQQGAVGAIGLTGLQGPAGPAGASGPQGPTGASGSNGAVGATGTVGPRGNTGPQGVTGPQGPQGDSGIVNTASCVDVYGQFARANGENVLPGGSQRGANATADCPSGKFVMSYGYETAYVTAALQPVWHANANAYSILPRHNGNPAGSGYRVRVLLDSDEPTIRVVNGENAMIGVRVNLICCDNS